MSEASGRPGRRPREPREFEFMGEGNGKIDIFESPEFKKAVEDAAARQVAKLLEATAAPVVDGAPGAIDPAVRALLDGLATSLADLAGQGSGRVHVDPAILLQREKARERMVDRILRAREKNEVPTYRVTGKTLLDYQLVDPFWIDAHHVTQPTEIDWPGIPNSAMVPINQAAKEIYAEWKDSVGSIAKVAPEDRLGVTHNGLVVRNGGVSSAEARRAPAAAESDAGLRVHHKGQIAGQAETIQVLGTIAPPAVRIKHGPGGQPPGRI